MCQSGKFFPKSVDLRLRREAKKKENDRIITFIIINRCVKYIYNTYQRFCKNIVFSVGALYHANIGESIFRLA